MTQLLVSVRNAEEAAEALAGGADLIDIKEPLNGPLGAADSQTWREVSQVANGRAPLSAALGELTRLADIGHVPQVSLVKAGLAGCVGLPNWQDLLAALRDQLPVGVGLVAVIYADADKAKSPSLGDIFRCAVRLRLNTLLVDTFDKAAGDLWDALTESQLAELIAAAHDREMQVALAGSISLEMFSHALQLRPDWIAVRGAACEDGRNGRVTRQKVAVLKERIRQSAPQRQVNM